ncbi:L-threonate dehydrogenase [Phaeovulum vinaykumarii]|uniref:L-threonate dehydrogenase n=1 Tax=Phaeovulum vinaykumarii TaxID=407234 RepID=A0A1N7M8U8_9RHOB|nr:L-threonate dehydrogenase [Phaeovulum vinaykumarii]SIS82401.1 3-hydroxyisobutyrate dehydrogenase/2-hydroxy-3-oxopropionate reductase [Phaeovulum vinaykumarii]SOC11008.1 3-hydroxyisobutyrate dehydrogenase/2-hydroxy-3-oxopropionate reductase [Phaeovulum vinaykumarii]
MAVVTVIGLGSMGHGMAQSLLRAGHEVHGFDIDAARMAAFRAEGGASADLETAAERSAVVVSVVLNAAQTEAVLFGPQGAAAHMPAGSVILSCATIPPAVARDMAGCAAALGLHYLDAPISGGAAKAAQGELSIMASGSAEAFAAARPALDAMAAVVHDLGTEVGAGSAMKAVNQLLAGVHIAAMGEALTLAASQGLDLGRVVEGISASAGSSWMFENRAPHVVGADYKPRSTVAIWPKDLGIISDIAGAAGCPVPMTASALAQFRAAAAAGLAGEDDAAVTKVYARAAHVTLPGEAP